MWKTIQERLHSPDAFVSMILGLAAILVVGVVVINMFSNVRTGQTTNESIATDSASIRLPTEHVVAEGETLWSIAITFYKSGYNWTTIRDANALENPDQLSVGQKLILPKADTIEVGQISSTSTQRLSPKDSVYTVKTDDTLWDICVAQYGTGYAWQQVSVINNLSDPNLLAVGDTLNMPVVDDP